jgi:membrane protease YdiL (CAAX protease family)
MENKSYPRIKNAILLCLLVLGIQAVGAIPFGIILALLRIGMDSIISGIGFIFLSLLSFGLVIFLGYKKTRKKFNEVFMFNKVPLNYWVSIIVFMLGFVIISSEIDNVVNYFLPMPSFFQDMFGLISVKYHIMVSIVLVGILPAFTEEMLFRGVILNGFRENYSPRKAVIVSAVLFGIIHLNPWQFVTAFIIGIISAWICIKTESILLCIYIHLFNNMLSVLAGKFKDIIPIEGFNTAYSEQTFQPIWFNIIGIVFTVTGIVLFLNSIKKAKNST